MPNTVPQPYFNNFTRNIVSSFWLPTWEETKRLPSSELKGVKERKQNWFNTDIYRSKLADTWLQQFYPSLGNFLQSTESQKELKKIKKKEEKKKKGYEDAKEKKRFLALKQMENEKLKMEGNFVENSSDENFDLYEVEQKEEQKVFLEKMKDIKSRKRKKILHSKKDEKKELKEPKERKKALKNKKQIIL